MLREQSPLLRAIPKVDQVLALPELTRLAEETSLFAVTAAVRQVLDSLREEILAGQYGHTPTSTELLPLIEEAVKQRQQMGLRPVINGTGVILHTNLGRSRLSKEAAKAAMEAACSYSTLEYDLEQGKRGKREVHVEHLLTRLTGAEDALVVNNNAAALLLLLSSITAGRQVIISRGELVEIGGSFRIPDILKQSGSILAEVGTTNKTRLQDYEDAIHPQETGALLKVHTSNYQIVGFTQQVALEELVALGQKHHLPVIQDLGSGALFSLASCGIEGEPTAAQSIQAGADVVTFSGDKLLGGPQAGIILGKKACLAPMKQHPLMRALRLDKMSLAALEATLRLYRDPREAFARIPTLQMLGCGLSTVRARACLAQTVEKHSQVGGGAVPNQMLPTAATALQPQSISVTELEHRLRLGNPPVLGRISKDRLLLDARTLEDRELPMILDCLSRCLGECS